MSRSLLLLTLFTGALVGAPPAAAGAAAVVASGQRPFQEAASAALAELDGDGTLHDATAIRGSSTELQDSVVVVSIGPLAGGSVAKRLPADARVVAVLTPRLMGLPPDRTLIVPLDPSADDVIEVTKRVLPKARRLGVLVGADSAPASELSSIGRRHGLEVIVAERDEALTAALDRLLPQVDVLWVDRSHTAVADPEAMKLVLTRSVDAGRPVVGSSKTHVLGGALFAVVPDPSGHGKVAGDIARRLLRGETVRIVPSPRGTVVLSSRAARTYGARVPPDLKGRVQDVR